MAKAAKKTAKKPPVKAKVKAKKVVAAKSVEHLDLIANVYSKILDKTEKDLELRSGLGEQKRLSTGLLVNDFINGGGLAPGMYSVAGQEASAKSTSAMTVLGSALESNIPIIVYFDAESAIDPDYTCGILNIKSLPEVFGDQDKDGNWTVAPRCRYEDTAVLEKVYKAIQSILNQIPDKVFRQADKKWYLVFQRDKKSIAMMRQLELKHSEKLYTSTGNYWCEIDESRNQLQALFVIDSYPALLPEDVDEGEAEGNGMALDARSFSKWVKRVKNKLRRKGAILYGVNQIRLNPGVRYGSPEYEPGGEALKFYSDNRNRMRAVVPQDDFAKSKENGAVCTEPSVEYEGATDTYAFKSIKNIKNKHGTPFRSGMSRVWTEDGNGKARGFDMVYDTWAFLKMIGAISGPRKKFKINLPGFDDVIWDWLSFKEYVLGEVTKKASLSKRIAKKLKMKGKPKRLRKACFALMQNGKAFDMFQNVKKSKVKSEDDDDDLEGDD